MFNIQLWSIKIFLLISCKLNAKIGQKCLNFSSYLPNLHNLRTSIYIFLIFYDFLDSPIYPNLETKESEILPGGLIKDWPVAGEPVWPRVLALVTGDCLSLFKLLLLETIGIFEDSVLLRDCLRSWLKLLAEAKEEADDVSSCFLKVVFPELSRLEILGVGSLQAVLVTDLRARWLDFVVDGLGGNLLVAVLRESWDEARLLLLVELRLLKVLDVRRGVLITKLPFKSGEVGFIYFIPNKLESC